MVIFHCKMLVHQRVYIHIIRIYDMTIVWIFEGWTWMHWVAIQNLCCFF